MTRPIRAAALAILLASPTMPGAIQAAAFAQAQTDTATPAATQAPQTDRKSTRLNSSH